MKLTKVKLQNFRSYKHETDLSLNSLTALIGQNDAGKSTYLEALEIFFNNDQIQIKPDDACVDGNAEDVRIICCFKPSNENIVIDSRAETNVRDEFLLNEDGEIEIVKSWNCTSKTPKEKVYARCIHPASDQTKDLLNLKITALRQRAAKLGVPENLYNGSVSGSILGAIRKFCGTDPLANLEISLNDDEGKQIWNTLKLYLPTYALFRSDRPSVDSDDEVQDPMKVAVAQALKGAEPKLKEINEIVEAQAKEVADRTIERLKEMNPELADSLEPYFETPKWENIFKLKINDDRGISINKRGSGTRRLILLNFFRAEADRLTRIKSDNSGVAADTIYAIEEPETSQHPSNQHLLIKSLIELSEHEDSQVILTTHVPGLAALLPVESIRYIFRTKDGPNVREDQNILSEVAETLGVVPDLRDKPQPHVVVMVEGTHDIEFLKSVSSTLHKTTTDIVDLSTSSEIVLLPVGGSNLKEWVEQNYLKQFGLPEVHIYDRDEGNPPKYKRQFDEINTRKDNSVAFLTNKREMENYIHPETINEIRDISVSFDDFDSVPEIVAKAVHESTPQAKPWSEVDEDTKKQKKKRAKRWLNRDAARSMSKDRIEQQDTDGEIYKWLDAVKERVKK